MCRWTDDGGAYPAPPFSGLGVANEVLLLWTGIWTFGAMRCATVQPVACSSLLLLCSALNSSLPSFVRCGVAALWVVVWCCSAMPDMDSKQTPVKSSPQLSGLSGTKRGDSLKAPLATLAPGTSVFDSKDYVAGKVCGADSDIARSANDGRCAAQHTTVAHSELMNSLLCCVGVSRFERTTCGSLCCKKRRAKPRSPTPP